MRASELGPSPTWTRQKTNKRGLPPTVRAGVAERPKAADSRSALAGVPRFESWPRQLSPVSIAKFRLANSR